MRSIAKILEEERQAHYNFFGREFDLEIFKAVLEKSGLETIVFWQGLGLEPHFLPLISLSEKTDFPGWREKPSDIFYQLIEQQKIVCLRPQEIYSLRGEAVLIDTYAKIGAMFREDVLLGPLIKKLRQTGEISDIAASHLSPRLGVSGEEWENSIKPGLTGLLSAGISLSRLERAIEANVIPQLYPQMFRPSDRETNTWVWFEERCLFAQTRLAAVPDSQKEESYYCHSSGRWHSFIFRPLIVLQGAER